MNRYLGDGVYASFDGYMLKLDLRGQPIGSHICEIMLEPEVVCALEKYIGELHKQAESVRPGNDLLDD